jgi:ankyrin repeat protein
VNGIQHSPRGLFDSTPLLQAAQNGQRETIRLQLEHGASISEQDGLKIGRWARRGSRETVAVLLDKGAVVSAQDLEGSTALHLAADPGHREIINLLIDHGWTPLHRSARLGYRAATKLLVDRGQ